MKLKPTSKIVVDPSIAILRRRTRDLSATNRRLELRLTRHKDAETALQEKHDHYGRLLEDSLQDQIGLRERTHHALASQEDERHKISLDLQDEIAQTLLGINVRLLSLKQMTRGSTRELKDEIASMQRLLRESARLVRKFASDLDIPPAVAFHPSVTRTRRRVMPSKTLLQEDLPSKP